ncbi:MazG nucleotide pyrophosphohydrolase domain-containing protein [Parendozoicomonas haliclonae]|uniref:MazG nucleotide pyrophosphohydrolase domain protein n=1 Tax=Parendozoicomonas haliclonae TaxID=1960125 RepID=A0A1X7AJR2_9GAMM|nr:MazG nucleotide pyrophosphohydrolase domain-containing protein [Parendozoicomonas haliclonae]SMA47026.1 MazG nucleotide pyrophosphohydrolase domain protein [Parendozoicomonas haliclonae]
MKLSEIQETIKEHDFNLENKPGYFMKLIEEVGELSEAIRKEKSGQPTEFNIKGSIAEELNDILYYVCALANVHDIDLEETYILKDKLNKVKYSR